MLIKKNDLHIFLSVHARCVHMLLFSPLISGLNFYDWSHLYYVRRDYFHEKIEFQCQGAALEPVHARLLLACKLQKILEFVFKCFGLYQHKIDNISWKNEISISDGCVIFRTRKVHACVHARKQICQSAFPELFDLRSLSWDICWNLFYCYSVYKLRGRHCSSVF